MNAPSEHFVALVDALTSGEGAPKAATRDDHQWFVALREEARAAADEWAAGCPEVEAIARALKDPALEPATARHLDACPLCAPMRELRKEAPSPASNITGALSDFLAEARRLVAPVPQPVPAYRSAGSETRFDWTSSSEQTATVGPYTLAAKPDGDLWVLTVTPAPKAGEVKLTLQAGERHLTLRIDQPRVEIPRAKWQTAAVSYSPAPAGRTGRQ